MLARQSSMGKKDLLLLGNKKHPEDLSMYDVATMGNVIGMWFCALQSSWYTPGKLAYTLTITPDGFVFKDAVLKQTLKLDYSQATALRALLKLQDNTGETFELWERK